MGIRKRFTILHSNDMHGDFLAEMRGEEGHLIGGLSLLSGYINEVRSEEKNVIYCIAGDMVQGSLIDAEYKGISTMEIMNYLSPDVASLGNHEFDYGLPHLLFLEKMANFPIVNANLYITQYNKRLFQPYVVKNVDGFDILFIGIITEKVMDMLKTDNMLSSFITLQEAAAEVGKICNAYKNDDIDLTVLLTHIGFDSDKELASLLDPAWGVDMIIGGHSHTILEQPAIVNNILIAQAGVGTDQVGRFDITVDDDTNSIVDWTWKLVPIDNAHCQPDDKLTAFIDGFKDIVDKKYGSIISKFPRTLTHPERTRETELGNLFADAIQEDRRRRRLCRQRQYPQDGAGARRHPGRLPGAVPLRRLRHPVHRDRRTTQARIRRVHAPGEPQWRGRVLPGEQGREGGLRPREA